EHCAIFYKKDELELIEDHTFWLSENPEVESSKGWDSSLPRICTWAHIRHKADGTEFLVFNTHLDHKGRTARVKGIELIWSRIREVRARKQLPAMLMGDFNSTPDELVVQIMRGEVPAADGMVEMKDVYAAIDGPIGTSANHQFSGNLEGGVIDYIFVTPEVEVLSAEIDRRRIDGIFPSDHYPVTARLQIT
ncbi:endonuclease/exonuclease/phosphatase family protein, partial [Paenibacillus sepulcri]|nr:endonuclease/exonuclease/phosphatase family protein [Paenibacillus sepulcri]